MDSVTLTVLGIDTFVTEAIDALSTRPQTVDEIGEASSRHHEFAKKKKEVGNNAGHNIVEFLGG